MCKVLGSFTQPCSASGNTEYLWEVGGSLPVLIKESSATSSTSYVYGPGGLPLELINANATYYFHHDQLGSTRLLTDSSGTSQAAYTYDPYGGLASSTGTITNPFRFCGQYQDAESGLYYLRARYYDPVTASFVSMDPMVAKTRQPFGYGMDSPLNSSDPTGLNTSGICASFGVTVPGLHFGVSGCVVVDDHGNVGTTVTTVSGFVVGASASGIVMLQGSNADTIYDLGGPFSNAGGSAGEVVVGGVKGYKGKDSCGLHDVYVGEAGLVEVHAGGSNTTVHSVFGSGPPHCPSARRKTAMSGSACAPVWVSGMPAELSRLG